MSDPIPLVVTKVLPKVYSKGLPSKPPLIATTKPGPFDDPTGLEAYSVSKELRELSDHPLAGAWDHGSTDLLRCGLNTMLDLAVSRLSASESPPVRPSSGLALVRGAQLRGGQRRRPQMLQVQTFTNGRGIYDYHVEIRESRIMRQAGNRFFDPVPLSDPIFTARDPYTATLGIPVSTKDRPWAEGTGGFYLGAGDDDKDIYLVTARHVVFPPRQGRQQTIRAQEQQRGARRRGRPQHFLSQRESRHHRLRDWGSTARDRRCREDQVS